MIVEHHDNRAPRRALFLVWRDVGHPEGGGSELFVERVAQHLVARGWLVTIACSAYPGARRDEVDRGVRIRRRGSRATVYLHGLAFLLSRTGRGADIVIDVQNGVPFFAPLIRRRPVVNLLHHVHREQWKMIYPGLRGRLGWWVESCFAPRLYRHNPYVTVSESTRRDLAELGIGADRVTIVHNGIDVPRPDVHRGVAAHPTICVLGRLVPHKRVEHALQAVAALRSTIPHLTADIIGDGWWRQPLEDAARQLRVDDIVRFHGNVSNDRRDALLDRAWVMLAPSIKEGWGIAVMEAAARGVPTIAYSSAGGVCESIVDGETGRLVSDLDELIKRAEELLGDNDLRVTMGEAARERAGRYSWPDAGDRFEELLNRNLQRP